MATETKLYLASSWRNALQPGILHVLRSCGHDVYDFRNPAPGRKGFAWSDIDPRWESWSAEQWRDALKDPIAREAFALDYGAIEASDGVALLLPAGRSASFELGAGVGLRKPYNAVICLEPTEPELMFLGLPILTTTGEVFRWAVKLPGGREPTA